MEDFYNEHNKFGSRGYHKTFSSSNQLWYFVTLWTNFVCTGQELLADRKMKEWTKSFHSTPSDWIFGQIIITSFKSHPLQLQLAVDANCNVCVRLFADESAYNRNVKLFAELSHVCHQIKSPSFVMMFFLWYWTSKSCMQLEIEYLGLDVNMTM